MLSSAAGPHWRWAKWSPVRRQERAVPQSGESPASGDWRLISDLVDGRLESLGELYDRYAALCWNAAKSLTDDERVAALAVTAAFMDVWRRPAASATAGIERRLIARTLHEVSSS